MNETKILNAYQAAKDQYAAAGVDVEAALARANAIPVSMHCWQGDDVIGFDGSDELSGGIATTGDYPGRARTPGKKIDRDAYTIDEFRDWLDWAKAGNIGLDFNPTYFSHPRMDGNFSLSSYD